MSNSLSSGLEDYIEAIYMAAISDVNLKGADLARKFNISRASVSEALSKLVRKGLINYNKYEYISLTSSGLDEAQKVYFKHNILKNFFETVLGCNSIDASYNACKIEHIVSENLLDRMEKLTLFFDKHKEISNLYIKENEL